MSTQKPAGKPKPSAGVKPPAGVKPSPGAKQPARAIWKGGNMLYPVPAVMVSCGDENERPNILTVAWTGTVCTNPPMVSVSIRPERYSYEIIQRTGAFVINLTTSSLAHAMDYCGVRSGRDVDKFREMHLTPVRAARVNAPLIAESPAALECAVTQVIELGSHHMFLAGVEAVNVDESLIDEKGALHLEHADLITYSHGTYYALGEALGHFGYSVRRRKKK